MNNALPYKNNTFFEKTKNYVFSKNYRQNLSCRTPQYFWCFEFGVTGLALRQLKTRNPKLKT